MRPMLAPSRSTSYAVTGHLKQARPDLREVEVGADLLGVDVELLAANQLAVVGGVGAGQWPAVGVVAARALLEKGEVATAGSLGQRADPVDEVGDRRAFLDHLDLGVEGRPVRMVEQGGLLGTQVEQLVQDRVVLGVGPIQEGRHQLGAGRGVMGEGAERDRVGIVGGEGHQAVVVDRVGVDEVLRQSGKLLRPQPDGGHVVTDVARELLAEQCLPVADLNQAGSGLLVSIDTRSAEVAQGQPKQSPGLIIEVGGVERRQHGE